MWDQFRNEIVVQPSGVEDRAAGAERQSLGQRKMQRELVYLLSLNREPHFRYLCDTDAELHVLPLRQVF